MAERESSVAGTHAAAPSPKSGFESRLPLCERFGCETEALPRPYEWGKDLPGGKTFLLRLCTKCRREYKESA